MYIATERPICLLLERQVVARAFSRACAKTGKRIAARIAIIAMTTSNSISVNALRRTMDSVSLFLRMHWHLSVTLSCDSAGEVIIIDDAFTDNARFSFPCAVKFILF